MPLTGRLLRRLPPDSTWLGIGAGLGVEDGSGGTTGAKLEVEGKTRLVEEGEDIKFSAKDFLCALVKGFLIVRAMEIF